MKRCLLLTMLLLNVGAAKSCAGGSEEQNSDSEKWKADMQAWLEDGEDGHSSEPIQSPRTSKVPVQVVGAVQQKLQEKIQEQKSDNQ